MPKWLLGVLKSQAHQSKTTPPAVMSVSLFFSQKNLSRGQLVFEANGDLSVLTHANFGNEGVQCLGRVGQRRLGS